MFLPVQFKTSVRSCLGPFFELFRGYSFEDAFAMAIPQVLNQCCCSRAVFSRIYCLSCLNGYLQEHCCQNQLTSNEAGLWQPSFRSACADLLIINHLEQGFNFYYARCHSSVTMKCKQLYILVLFFGFFFLVILMLRLKFKTRES